jgi:hypothetical protein
MGDVFHALCVSFMEDGAMPKDVVISMASALVDLIYGLTRGCPVEIQDGCLEAVFEGMREQFCDNQSEEAQKQ